MKKATLIDILEGLSRAHSLADSAIGFIPEGQSQNMVRSVKYKIEDALAEVKQELKR
jgi:hypothetical protein